MDDRRITPNSVMSASAVEEAPAFCFTQREKALENELSSWIYK